MYNLAVLITLTYVLINDLYGIAFTVLLTIIVTPLLHTIFSEIVHNLTFDVSNTSSLKNRKNKRKVSLIIFFHVMGANNVEQDSICPSVSHKDNRHLLMEESTHAI